MTSSSTLLIKRHFCLLCVIYHFPLFLFLQLVRRTCKRFVQTRQRNISSPSRRRWKDLSVLVSQVGKTTHKNTKGALFLKDWLILNYFSLLIVVLLFLHLNSCNKCPFNCAANIKIMKYLHFFFNSRHYVNIHKSHTTEV